MRKWLAVLPVVLVIALLFPSPAAAGGAPAGMVEIPAGEFNMGINKKDINYAVEKFQEAPKIFDNAQPYHTVNLPTFYIDKFEVTNKQYHRFVSETGSLAPEHWAGGKYSIEDANKPVVNVSLENAHAFAAWCGKRIPTEAEWEKAARGADGRIFPWGAKYKSKRANDRKSRIGKLSVVGSFPKGASPYGVMDMTGNVWEWTSSFYKAYPGSDHDDEFYGEERYVVRGGSYDDNAVYGVLPLRQKFTPVSLDELTGFRCVVSTGQVDGVKVHQEDLPPVVVAAASGRKGRKGRRGRRKSRRSKSKRSAKKAKVKRMKVAVSAFPSGNIVEQLKSAKILISSKKYEGYVYFTKKIKTESKLAERLNKAGINNHAPLVELWKKYGVKAAGAVAAPVKSQARVKKKRRKRRSRSRKRSGSKKQRSSAPIEQEMILVPAGRFTMGIDFSELVDMVEKLGGMQKYFDSALPAHQVDLPAFYIDKYEVTNYHYKKFVDATKRTPPENWKDGSYEKGMDNHPVVWVTWDDATAYAKWIGKRLPTEAEWEKASRGARGFMLPWGKLKYGRKYANTYEAKKNKTTPVGDYEKGVSQFGAYDMAGNVWEWTSSLYTSYENNPHTAEDEFYNTGRYVLRGGSFMDMIYDALTIMRAKFTPQTPDENVGFRCAKDK